jgi:hypothetical protein
MVHRALAETKPERSRWFIGGRRSDKAAILHAVGIAFSGGVRSL